MRTISLRQPFAAVAVLVIVLLAGSIVWADEAAGVQQVAHNHHCSDGCCDDACCGDACCDDGCCGDGCCGDGCCRKVCVASVETKKVEKHCWKTEAKDVCIPDVVLPWEDGGCGLNCSLFGLFKKRCGDSGCGDACCGDACCGDGCCGGADCCHLKPRCGKVITVCDLKKEKYECDKCVCKWEIKRLPPLPCCGKRGCHGGGCFGGGSSGCGDSCCDPACGANASERSDEIQLASAVEVQPASASTTPDQTAEPAVEAEDAGRATWFQRLLSVRK